MPKNNDGTFAQTHGIYAFQARGEPALPAVQVSRLVELRELVRSQPGRQSIREELLARCVLVCELAFGEMGRTVAEGRSLWKSPSMTRAATWVAETRRLLQDWPPNVDVVEGEAREVREKLGIDES